MLRKYFTLREALPISLASVLTSGSPIFAATPTSSNYALPSSTINNGVAYMV